MVAFMQRQLEPRATLKLLGLAQVFVYFAVSSCMEAPGKIGFISFLGFLLAPPAISLEEREGQRESRREEAEVQSRVLSRLPGTRMAGHSPAMLVCRKQMTGSIV